MHQLAEQVVTGVQDPAGQLSLIAETVAEEVAFGPANLGLPRDEIDDRTETALRLTGIRTLPIAIPFASRADSSSWS